MGIITSAKHAEKALLAKVPANERSDLDLESATMAMIQRKKKKKVALGLGKDDLGCSFLFWFDHFWNKRLERVMYLEIGVFLIGQLLFWKKNYAANGSRRNATFARIYSIITPSPSC